MAKRIQVGGRIECKEVGGIVTGAAEILDDAKEKKQSVINQETDDELVRLDQSKQDNLTFDNAPTEGSDNPVKSGGVYAADKALSDAIEAILLLIPSAASALNKLVDTSMMNSSISTATATFRGTYNVVTDLSLTIDATHEQIAAALGNAISTADNNDYAFVQVPVSAESTDIRRTERYKFNGTAWGYEYDLNTSGFSAAQWAAINSGITLALVGKLIGLPTSSELQALLGQKQDTLTFDNIPVSGSANPVKSGGVYSVINDEKTAREQLAQTVTGINGRLGDVEEVIPTGAAANNKLVANNSMEAYVTSIIEAITASFTIATADGHINLTLTQTNGRVASLTLTTSDIASAQALTALTGRVSTAEGNITTLGGRVSTNETDIANLQQLYNDLQQSKPVPVTALPETGQQQGVIYRLAGTTSYSDYMWNGSTWVLMATYNNAIDSRPKKASQNLVTSGGVFDNMGALDVSELNATENPHTLAQYADLSAALAAIPTDYQKGGMSIKFVQSSDNKYVQYFLTKNTWSASEADWEKVNLEEEVSQLSQKLIKLAGIRSDTESWDDIPIGGICYNTTRKLLRRKNSASSYSTIPYYDGAIYTYNSLLYGWNGNDLAIITDKVTIDSADNNGGHIIRVNDQVMANMADNNKLIKVYKMLDESSPDWSNVPVGSIVYNLSTKLLRIKNSNNKYSTIQYYDGAIYTYNNELYVWNGSDLVLSNLSVTPNISDIPFVNDWVSNTHYQLGDRVKYGGHNYICGRENTDSDFTPWKWSEPVAGGSKIATIQGVNIYDHCIKLKGIDTEESASHISATGDIVYNSSMKLLRMCTNWTGNPDTSSYVTVDFLDGAIYVIDTSLYVYNAATRSIVPIDSHNAIDAIEVNCFVPNTDELVVNQSLHTFKPSTEKIDFKYKGEVNPSKRYLAIGFDDFWDVDFVMTQPIFSKYNANATFNKIIIPNDIPKASKESINKVLTTLFNGNEVGDHTFAHSSFFMNYPLWDGNTFPSNDAFRVDVGDGKNAFGETLTNSVPSAFGNYEHSWAELTDAECQSIRESHAIISTLVGVFDTLSNKYLGTTGSSANSWNGTKYTGGIFTDCKTSANHEIWERVLAVTAMYYKDQFGMNYNLKTWCFPGGDYNLYFYDANTGVYYYDAELTLIANDLARFTSSYIKDDLGNFKSRSFVDVLRSFGYEGTHGSLWPSKWDGQSRVAMYENLFFNEVLSRQDALLYPTDLNIVDYLAPYGSYPETFFDNSAKYGTQMYDKTNEKGNRSFRTYIEYIRNATARHSIAGGVFDAHNDYSSRMFFEELLKWCKAERIEVIPKATAYDICFNYSLECGNLIGNAELKNSASDYFTDSNDLPTNPDGYIGNCSVINNENNIPILVTTGDTKYVLYGIPIGKLTYTADVKGSGTITIKLIKNNSNAVYVNGLPTYSGLETFATININSDESFVAKVQDLSIYNNPLTNYEQKCEGYGNKIMGIEIIYSGGLQIKNIKLVKD